MSNIARGRKPRLWLETLEERTLPSVTPGVIDVSGVQANTSVYDPSHILVRFRNDALAAQSLVQGTTLDQKLSLVDGLFVVGLGEGVSVDQALAAYRASANVLEASPDYLLETQGTPNDTSFSQMWSLNNTGQGGGKVGADIHALAAWSVTTGSRRVIVSVMDTGIDYTHPDLYQNIWLNQAEIPLARKARLIDVDADGLITFADLNDTRNQGAGKITDLDRNGRIDANDILAPMVKDAAGNDTGAGGWADLISQDGDKAHLDDLVGWNFVANTNRPFDDYSHGTHIAGTIGAMGNNSLGVVGVNWQVSLMPIKFLDSGGHGSIGAFIDGLNYAVAHGAKISNNSWSGAANTPILSDAINAARNKGHIFVASAGNGGVNSDTAPVYPADFPIDNIVSVAASDRYDKLAGFSAYGVTTVDLAAPGVGILSTTPGGKYETWDGTSMATPQVAGVLALVWAKNPTWTYRQVIDQVLRTVDVLPAFQGKTATGGRLNAAAALGFKSVVLAPQVLSSTPSGPVQNSINAIRVTFSKTINAATFTPGVVSLLAPGGKPVVVSAVTAVANSGGKQFDITFATQTAPGAYTLALGSQIRDTDAAPLSPYQATFAISNVSTFASTTKVSIPDMGKASSAITIATSSVIGRLEVVLNLTHTYDNDLYIHLTSPAGTDILLSNRRGGAGDNFVNTRFSDSAAVSISTGVAPFTGTFRPEAPLSNFNTENTKGVWTLWVEDRGAGDVGAITGWSLVITSAATGTAVTQSVGVSTTEVPSSHVQVVSTPSVNVVAPIGYTTAVDTSTLPGDLWRGLNPTPVIAPTSYSTSGASPSTDRITDRVFAAPGAAGDFRAIAWLSRLQGAEDEGVAVNDLGSTEEVV